MIGLPVPRRVGYRAVLISVALVVMAGLASAGDGWLAGTRPPAVANLAAAASPVDITVSTAVTGHVAAGFAGFSYEKDRIGAGVFDPANTKLVRLFRLLGPSVLRLGGNLVDIVGWNDAGTGGSPGQVAPSDVTKLAAFLRATNWKAIYGINLKTNTPAGAASEASFAAGALGDRLLAFEIGNEPNFYLDERGYESAYDSYVRAIRMRAPAAVFDGPGPYQHAGWIGPFAVHEKNNGLVMLSMHSYTGNGAIGTIPQLLAGNPGKFSGDETELAAAAVASGVGHWRMTEANSFYRGGTEGVSDTEAAALWSLDFMYGVAAHRGDGVNFHGGTSTQFPLRYSPIVFAGAVPTGVGGVYYGELLWTLAGTGPLREATVIGNTNVTAWGVGNNVFVSNKGPWAVTATVTLSSSAGAADGYLLTAPSLDSTATIIAGSGVSGAGDFHPSPVPVRVSGRRVVIDVPAGSAALVTTR